MKPRVAATAWALTACNQGVIRIGRGGCAYRELQRLLHSHAGERATPFAVGDDRTSVGHFETPAANTTAQLQFGRGARNSTSLILGRTWSGQGGLASRQWVDPWGL